MNASIPRTLVLDGIQGCRFVGGDTPGSDRNASVRGGRKSRAKGRFTSLEDISVILKRWNRRANSWPVWSSISVVNDLLRSSQVAVRAADETKGATRMAPCLSDRERITEYLFALFLLPPSRFHAIPAWMMFLRPATADLPSIMPLIEPFTQNAIYAYG